MLKLFVDPESTYPIHEQIKEGLRMALAFGELRPGDTLPSIRELAAELKTGPGIVRRAYEELARAGLLDISRSRRVIVNRDLQYKRENLGREKDVRHLAEKLQKEVLELGIHPQSFALYFQHWMRQSRNDAPFILMGECNRVQAEQFAADVSQAWGVPVKGLDFDTLRRISHKELQGARHLCTIPFHYEEACQVARKHKLNVVTISVHWDAEMLDHIAKQKAGSRVAFVFKKSDLTEYGKQFLKQVESLFPGSDLKFGGVALEDIEPVQDWIERGEWELMFFSNRIWDELPDAVRSRPDVATPTLRPDPVSLEKARLEVGILS
ncbi:MAG: GntR family transcriptional regulator [Candidatus Sulfotelmatobacter sp.]